MACENRFGHPYTHCGILLHAPPASTNATPLIALCGILAGSLAIIDFYYVFRGTIARIYLADRIAELLFSFTAHTQCSGIL